MAEFEVYGRSDCPYCTKVCDLLESNQIYDYQYTNIDFWDYENKKTLVEQRAAGAKTVPIVIIDGQYIGGYNELKQYFETKDAE